MPKLTETTNDKTKRGRQPAAPPTQTNGSLHIDAPHEPLAAEPGGFDIPEIRAPLAMENPVVMSQHQPSIADVPALRTPKVAIVGTAPSSRLLAPFSDPNWTIWACSPGNMTGLPRVDIWFEIHGDLLTPENKHYGEQYVNWMKTLQIPVYTHETWPTPDDGGGFIHLKDIIPNHRPFPKDTLIEEFGRDFFSSSFAWMIAYAMHLGAKEISLYGVDMASRDEYILQRPGFYFFKYLCKQRGIRISAPNESDIMMAPPLYGYSEVTPFARKMYARRKEIRDRANNMETELRRMQENLTYLRGADEDIDYVLSIHGGVQDNN